jgi:predicted amidohydrolase
MKIGMIQLLLEGTEPERNILRALTYLDKAVASKCDLVMGTSKNLIISK